MPLEILVLQLLLNMAHRVSFNESQSEEVLGKLGLKKDRIIPSRRGSVLLALTSTERVVIKIADKQNFETENVLVPSRSVGIKNEVEMLSKLRDGIGPKVLNYFEDEKIVYSVLEYFSGQKLDLNAGVTRVTTYIRKLLNKLCILHSQNVIHGDVQPENILCLEDSDGQIIDLRLIDFEFSRIIGDSGPSHPGLYHFLSPKAASKIILKEGDFSMDLDEEIFAIAATCLAMVRGSSFPLDYGPTVNSRKDRLLEISKARYSTKNTKSGLISLSDVLVRSLNSLAEERPKSVNELEIMLFGSRN